MIVDDIWTLSYSHVFLKFFLALVLGGIIGYEREMNNHPAGFRTHILVSIGSTLIMLISIYGFTDYLQYSNVRFDPSRIAAQVVTGIGFLGAGTILRHGFTVTGLTTAASLWVVAGIGMAIGTGLYIEASVATFFVLISLAVLAKLDPYITRKRQLVQLRVNVIDSPGMLGSIATKLGERKINVKSVSITEEDEKSGETVQNYVSIIFVIKVPKNESIINFIDQIKYLDGVKEVQFGKNTE